MRSVISIIILLFAAASPVFSQESNQCSPLAKTQIYFSNGMFTDQVDANRRLADIERHLSPQLSGIEYGLSVAYNENEGSHESGAYGFTRLYGIWKQVQEVALQAAGDSVVGFLRWASGIVQLPDIISLYSDEIADAIEYKIAIEDADVQEHVSSYLADLNEGNRIIILAHSQGNYYANLARNLTLEKYRTQNAGLSADASISILSIASPATVVSGGSSHVTLEEDFIINTLRRNSFSPENLPANVTNSNRHVLEQEDWTGHGLKAHYLSGTESGQLISTLFREVENRTSFPNSNASEGVVTVTLTWGEPTDVDLHVYEPDGTHVYYLNRTGTSGYLDQDIIAGYGPEHYFADCDGLLSGEYRVGVNYFSGQGTTGGDVVLQVGPLRRTYTFSIDTPLGSAGDEPPTLATFSVSEGDDGNFVFSVVE